MPNQDILREYRKERKRVRDLIRRMKQRGYIDLDDVLPPIPKKITEGSVRRLKEITPKKLQEKARYVTPGGQVVSGTRGRWMERQRAAKKISETQKKKAQEKKAKQPEKAEAPAPEKPGKQEKKETTPPPPPAPSEADIIEKRIREFIGNYMDENPGGAQKVLDYFDQVVSEQKAKDDNGEGFFEKLKEKEEELAGYIDLAIHYKASSPQFESHFSRVREVLSECAAGSGSSMLNDDDNELPFF